MFDKNGKFIDYIFENFSDNLENLFHVQKESIIGKKITDFILEHEDEKVLDFKEIFYNMIPKTRKKFIKYIFNINRWYLISIFSDEKEYMLVVFNDITNIYGDPAKSFYFDHGNREKIVCDYLDSYFKDKLTNLYNRDFFEGELKKLDSEENQLPISIIICDINGLKVINDAFGHHIGDLFLQKAANAMQSILRKGEILCRIGGDEFSVILPKTDEKKASLVVRRLKEACENIVIDFIKLSVSFGLAAKDSMDESIREVMRKADDRMYYQKLKESKKAKVGIINHLKDKLENISYETKQHYERLKTLCLKMSKTLNLKPQEIEELKLLCEYHDIGKVCIPEEIFLKQESLTNTEWEAIRRHSEVGYRIFGAIHNGIPVHELILNHHERWDGKGYPNGLKGEEIPLSARIFSIVDAFDAMINERPYREKMTVKMALEEIGKQAGYQFDPNLTRLFIEIMSDRDGLYEKSNGTPINNNRDKFDNLS